MRARVAQYLLVILLHYSEASVSKHHELIEDSLHKLLQDAKPDVRQVARLSFFRYKSEWPQRIVKVTRGLSTSNYRAIEDENEQEILRVF